jgi:DNA polymerase II small subunit
MDSKEIINFCLKKGLLVDKDVLNLFSGAEDIEITKTIIERFSSHIQQRIITKEVLKKNKEKFNEFLLDFPESKQKNLEKLKINLGLSIKISRVSEDVFKNVSKEKKENKESKKENKEIPIKVVSMGCFQGKKLSVPDFVSYFRNRFSSLKAILEKRSELKNLVSIGKFFGDRQNCSLIGMVLSKRVTKNKNIILEIEDLTGRIKVLINSNKKELYQVAEEITLDSVLGFKGSGNRDIFFANDIFFPDSFLPERKKSNIEEYALFIGDLHYGSKLFLKKGFLKFIDYLNGKVPGTPEVSKIKYLFIVGDVISGVGNYPDQEKDLDVVDLEEQFIGLANLLKKIRKEIKIIISPGNHDCMRIMEPQPIFDEKYAWPLHELDNVILTGNPSQVNIAYKKGFSGFDVLVYHGFSFPYYAGNIPSLIKEKAMHSPEKIVKFLLKNRHLAPTHSSTQYFPMKKDPLLIEKIPDIIVVGHVHKSAVAYYNNILIVSVSSWEGMTPYEEKMGADPDFCKVPMLNLNTREIKILDFEESREIEKKKDIKEEMKIKGKK